MIYYLLLKPPGDPLGFLSVVFRKFILGSLDFRLGLLGKKGGHWTLQVSGFRTSVLSKHIVRPLDLYLRFKVLMPYVLMPYALCLMG